MTILKFLSNYKYLLIIILLGLLLRILWLEQFPPGFSGDEVQQGYSAYSILFSGKDEWGEFLPLNPRGFGDFKPPILTYLIIPSIRVFGFNENAIRLPTAIFGTLTILVVYFLARTVTSNKEIGLWSAFFLSINPWHIQLSRTAFEGGIGIFLFTLGLLFFIKEKQNLILASLFWALSFYTYHSFKVFVPLFILGLLIKYRPKNFKKNYFLPAVIFIILLLPLLFSFKQITSRASDVGIFSQQKLESYFKEKGVSPLPYFVDRVFNNKVFYLLNGFLDNYFSYYSLTFFFTGSRPDSSYLNFPHFPLVYRIELILWIIAGYLIITKKVLKSYLILLWFLLAPIAAALSEGSLNANRAIIFLPLISILSGVGLASFNKKQYIKYIIFCFLILNFFQFLYFYTIQLPQKPPQSLRGEYKQVFSKIWELEKNYDEVVMSRVFSVPQIFLAYYGKFNPTEYQKASRDWLRYEKANRLYVDQLESWNLGKFLFEDIDYKNKDSKRVNALLISTSTDFPDNAPSIYDVKNSKGDIIYKFIETRK